MHWFAGATKGERLCFYVRDQTQGEGAPRTWTEICTYNDARDESSGVGLSELEALRFIEVAGSYRAKLRHAAGLGLERELLEPHSDPVIQAGIFPDVSAGRGSGWAFGVQVDGRDCCTLVLWLGPWIVRFGVIFWREVYGA